MFRDLDEKQKKKMQLGNTKQTQVVAKSHVVVDTSHDKVNFLDDVQFLQNLGFTLINIGQLLIE